MSNYDAARVGGTGGSRYLLDSSFDYFGRKPPADYGRNSDYTHGSTRYEPTQYNNTTFDSYATSSARDDYNKYRYDKYGTAGKNYGRQNGQKVDMRDLRNTTNVLPSYLAEQRKRDFAYSPRKDTDREVYDRRPMKTTYEAAGTTSKPWRETPAQTPYEKADYLSPSKYDKGTSSTSALSPNHYSNKYDTLKYDNKTKLNELMARFNKLQSSPQPTPTSPREQDRIKQEMLLKKYEKYLPSSSGTTGSSSSSGLASKYPEYQSPLYQSSSYTDSKKKEQYTPTLLTDSKSGDLFKKKKDSRDVKSPDKDPNKRISTYTSTLKKEESPSSYLTQSKVSKEATTRMAESVKVTSSTVRDSKEIKISSPTYGLSSSNVKFHGEAHLKDFEIGKSKGEGKFGQVFAARHKATASLFALKKIPKETIKQHMMEDQLVLEIKLQAFLDHPNILKLYTFFTDDKNIYLVLEYMEEGTLFEHLKRRKDRMSEKEVSRRIAEIANAIKYLHDLDIAHRDIKPENIVLSNGMGKLCDFGWATRCTNRRKTYCGTFDYVAPEILEGKQYDWCVDLWCLGVLTYELLMGKVPFYNISRKETMKKILSCGSDPLTFSSDISWQARDFVQCLIKKSPQQRRRADQLMEHPFLSKHLDTDYLKMSY